MSRNNNYNNDDEDNENIRAFDNTYRDNLLPSNVNLDVAYSARRRTEEDDDPMVRIALEESLKMYEKERELEEQLRRIESEKRQEDERKCRMEEERTQKLRERFGMIMSRLKTVYRGDPIAADLVLWIEWEMTPTHLLTTFRPKTSNTILQMKEWAYKNLNPAMMKDLETLSFF